jgi:hypothetical protein
VIPPSDANGKSSRDSSNTPGSDNCRTPRKRAAREAPATMSPFSQGISIYAPKKSAKVVTSKEGNTPAWKWSTEGGNLSQKRVGSRQIATLAKDMERFIAEQANHVSENAADIVEATLNKRLMRPIKDKLLLRFKSSMDTVMEDTAIVNQVEEFLTNHTSKGTREKTSQDAVDAVLVELRGVAPWPK